MQYQIAFFDQIFEFGGYYDQAKDGYIHEANADDGIKRIRKLYEHTQYLRHLPDLTSSSESFLTELRASYSNVEAKCSVCPASLALEIKQAFVHDSVIYPQTPDGLNILYFTYRPNDRPYVKQLDAASFDTKTATHIPRSNRRILYIGSAGSFNYGHFLVDDLPRIKIINEEKQPTTILMQSFGHMDQLRMDAIKYMTRGRDVQYVFINPADTFYCENLVYVTPVSVHPYLKNREALNYVRDFATSRKRKSLLGERLFVKRQAGRGRRLKNELAVEAILTTLGFRSIDPESMPFNAQVNAFANASVVVGTMGAAMCNTLFMKPGAKLLYLAPNDWMEPFYWDMAAVLGHEYKVLYGDRDHTAPEPYNDDFSIDTDCLKRLIASLL